MDNWNAKKATEFEIAFLKYTPDDINSTSFEFSALEIVDLCDYNCFDFIFELITETVVQSTSSIIRNYVNT